MNISDCSQCHYDILQTKIKCNLCNDNFVLYEEDNLCLAKENINKTFYYLNETHINKCSNSINNCDECQDNTICLKCKNNFYMINDETNNCIQESKINEDESYLNDDNTMYYSCNNILYQDVLNCKKCLSKSHCTLCRDGFTFINGDKSICVEKKNLKDKYIQDTLDLSNYIKCENKYSNCDSCNDIRCLSCKNEFIFINEIYSQCTKKSLLNLDLYFTNDEITYFSCLEEKYKNREECKKILDNLNPKSSNIIKTENLLLEPLELFIFQVQIIRKHLRIFISPSHKTEKNFHIKLPINIYKSNNKIRNLQENAYREQEVDLYLSENNEVEQGEILSLTSIKEFDESDRIVINQEKSHDCEIKVLNNDNKILDTQENKKMIENKEIIDFSEVPSTFTSNKYYIESSSKGCHFNLVSKNQIEEENQNIILNFIEKNNENKKISAKCILSKENKNNIPCSLNEDIVNKKYILDSYVGSNKNGVFYLIQDKDDFELNCEEEEENSDESFIYYRKNSGWFNYYYYYYSYLLLL
jgi:hypothetical protein